MRALVIAISRNFLWMGGPFLTFFSGNYGAKFSKNCKKGPTIFASNFVRVCFDMIRARNINSRMTCPIPGGFLVAIEGIDGSGKSTQAQLLAQFCAGNNLECVVSKEPTRGIYGRLIRDSALRGRMAVEKEIEILRKDR